MKKLLFLLFIPLVYFVCFAQPTITGRGIISVNDTNTTVYPWQITFSPVGGVADDGDGTATINLDTALASTYLKLDNSNQASWTPTTTLVTNLNADLLDGVHGSTFVNAVSDTASLDLTLTGQSISGAVLPAGVDHGGLGGLADDDHTQYRLESADHSHQSTGLQAGTLDHGLALTGLTDDDHTQYALLAGRSGGQTLIGGTGTTDDLILRTTSGIGATGADIIFQVGNNGATEAMRILNSGYIGMGIAVPEERLHIYAPSGQANFLLEAVSTNDVRLTFKNGNRAWYHYIDSTGNYFFRDATQGRMAISIEGEAVEKTLYLSNYGNVGIGTGTPGGGTNTSSFVLSIANGAVAGANPPTGGRANQVSLYSADVTASAELFGLDEAGNTPQLTPHPSDFLNTLPIADRPYPWAYTSSNPYLGKKITVDMAGVVAEVERLSGKKFAFVTDIPKIDWDENQERQRIWQNETIAKLEARIAELEALILQASGDKKVELEWEKASVIVPQPYQKKPPPKWMRDRGVASLIF